MGDPLREAHLGSVLRCALAAASFGAGLIHATAVSTHRDHHVLAAFFVLLAVAQVGWALAVLRRPTAALLKFGAALSVGAVLIWVLSRTTGLSGVPGAEVAERIGLKDGLATALEMVLAAGVWATFAGFGAGLRAASGRLASGLAVVFLGVLTGTGMAASGHGHHSKDGDHWSSLLASGGHHGDRPAEGHGHESADRSDGGVSHPHNVTAAHGHSEAEAGHGPDAGHGHTPSAVSAAGDHDHDAPGHLHNPAHHQAGAASHLTGEQHAAPGHEAPGHEPSAPGHQGAASGHEAPHGTGQGGGDPHGGHGSVNRCDGPVPDQRVSRDVQEYATYYLHVTCLEPSK